MLGIKMIALPDEYTRFIQSVDKLYGDTDYEFGGYFDLEPLETVNQMNEDIQIEQYAPGFIAFASNGGGEVFVFDKNGAVYLLPLIGMEPGEAVKLASSWSELEHHIQPNAQQDR
jgi:hypothetical protein